MGCEGADMGQQHMSWLASLNLTAIAALIIAILLVIDNRGYFNKR